MCGNNLTSCVFVWLYYFLWLLIGIVGTLQHYGDIHASPHNLKGVFECKVKNWF